MLPFPMLALRTPQQSLEASRTPTQLACSGNRPFSAARLRLATPHSSLATAPLATVSHRKFPRPMISPATPLESTLPSPPASTHSKSLTATLFPLESTHTRKEGRGYLLWLTRHPTKRVCPTEHRDEGSLFAPTSDFFPERPLGARDVSSAATERFSPDDHRGGRCLPTLHPPSCPMSGRRVPEPGINGNCHCEAISQIVRKL